MNRHHYLSILALAGLCAAAACASEAKDDHGTPVASADHRAPVVSAESLAKGKATYMTVCAPCHGEHGKGDGPSSKIFKPSPRDHTDGAYMNAISDEDLARIITMGGLVRGKPNMPGNPQLRGAELTSLIGYVRSLAHTN